MSFALFQLGGYIPDLKKKVNKDVETAVAEFVEPDPNIFLVGCRMRGKKLLDMVANSSSLSRVVS